MGQTFCGLVLSCGPDKRDEGSTHAGHPRSYGKIQASPPERIAEVEDFVAFITAREHDRRLTRAASAAHAPAFAAIWNKPDDDAYNVLRGRFLDIWRCRAGALPVCQPGEHRGFLRILARYIDVGPNRATARRV